MYQYKKNHIEINNNSYDFEFDIRAVIEYKENTNVWGIVLDVGLTVLPIVAIVIFLSWMMRQATAANSQSLSVGKSKAQMYGPDK